MARAERMRGQFPSETKMGSDGIVQRRCVFCGDWKPLEEDYPKNGVDPAGNQVYRLDCKKCYKIRRQENTGRGKKRTTDFLGGQRRRGEEAPELSHQEWKEVMIFFGGDCSFCGATPTQRKRLTRDHLHPVSKGGKTEAGNIVPACASCNSSKGDEDFRDWFMKQSFFSQARLNRIFQWRAIMRQVGGSRNDERQ